jgi:hypothetical protein
MARPLIAGYLLLSLLVVSAIAAFGGLELLLGQSTQVAETAEAFCNFTLLVTYVALWIWMLIDHIFFSDSSHPVLIGIFLVLGGGIAALAYFFLVFRPRYTQSLRGAARQP